MFNYHSQRWEHKRQAILRRDRYLCQECLRYGRHRQATTVHHKQHVDAHPELAFQNDNLVSLCQGCHNKKHPEKAKATRKKY